MHNGYDEVFIEEIENMMKEENEKTTFIEEKGRQEQMAKTEAERRRADKERQRADAAERRIKELEDELARLVGR